MNYIDIIIAIPLIFAGFKGFTRGLVVELASLAGLILGIYAAYHFSAIAMPFVSKIVHADPAYQRMAAFALTFLVVLIAVHLIGKLIEKIVDLVALGFANKIAGLAFGVLKGALVISVVIFVITTFASTWIPKNKETSESLLYSPVASLAPFLIGNIKQFKPSVIDEKADSLQPD